MSFNALYSKPTHFGRHLYINFVITSYQESAYEFMTQCKKWMLRCCFAYNVVIDIINNRKKLYRFVSNI